MLKFKLNQVVMLIKANVPVQIRNVRDEVDHLGQPVYDVQGCTGSGFMVVETQLRKLSAEERGD